ncbi:hypothetical protein HQ587_06845 [bacterium]|nr:hypothetical protein [bacterium]
MILFPTIISAVIVLSFAHAGNENQKDNFQLPAWFWDTPVAGSALIAVGYSQQYRESEHAYKDAFHDGAWRLFRDLHSRISGERGISTVAEGTMNIGSTIRQEIDSTGFSAFSKTIIRLDSASTPTQRIMLVSTRDIPINRELLPEQSVAPEITGSHLAQGSSQLYYHESSSWIEAEREARIELAIGTFSSLKGQTEIVDDNVFQTSITKTDVILTDILTMHRRIDRKKGLVTVWVRGSVRPNVEKP